MATASKSEPDPVEEFRYNDDLLLSEDTRTRAASDFKGIYHVLHFPELRDAFTPVDNKANHAKKWSQATGLLAVVFALLALLEASSSSLWEHEQIPRLLAIVSAAFGLLAVLIGLLGILFGARKRKWLLNRLFTERLRQFHFQTLIWRLDQIANSCQSDSKKQEFINERQKWLEAFIYEYTTNAITRIGSILKASGVHQVWLHPIAKNCRATMPQSFDPSELFKSYRQLRIEAQIAYAEHKIREDTYSFNLLRFLKLPLRAQRKVLRSFWTFAIGILISMHVVMLTEWHLMEHSIMDVLIIWAALVALATKALEEGLALTREIERYEDYRDVLNDLRTRFDESKDNDTTLEIMVDMERVSFEEMRNFLRSSHEATFIL
jgi:hypothetical protein